MVEKESNKNTDNGGKKGEIKKQFGREKIVEGCEDRKTCKNRGEALRDNEVERADWFRQDVEDCRMIYSAWSAQVYAGSKLHSSTCSLTLNLLQLNPSSPDTTGETNSGNVIFNILKATK